MDDGDHALKNLDRFLPGLFLPGILVGSLALQTMIAAPAWAQLAPWGGDTNVLVDQSIISGGSGVPPQFDPLRDRSGLLVPPPRVPRSSLLVTRPPVDGILQEEPLPEVKLVPPSERRKIVVTRPAAKPAPKPRAAEPAEQQTAALPSGTDAGSSMPAPMETPTPLTEQKPAEPATSMPEPSPEPPSASDTPPPVMEAPPPAVEAPKIEHAKPAPKPKPKVEEPKTEEKVAATSPEAPPPAPPIPSPAVETPPPPPPPPAEPEQQAKITPGPSTSQPSADSVTFAPGDATLSEAGRKALDAVAARMNGDEELRMQLLAYAGDPDLSSSRARRLSLSRALAVRSYLIGKGVRSTRIDVRALGNRVPDGSPNRVDLRVVER